MSLFLHEPDWLRDVLYNVLITDVAQYRLRGALGWIFHLLLRGIPKCLMHNFHCSELAWYHLVWNEHISKWQLHRTIWACGRHICPTVITRPFSLMACAEKVISVMLMPSLVKWKRDVNGDELLHTEWMWSATMLVWKYKTERNKAEWYDSICYGIIPWVCTDQKWS